MAQDQSELYRTLTRKVAQPPLKFGLFFDYDLDGRLDLLLANGHLEPEISKVQASETYERPVQLFWHSGQARRNLYLKAGPESAGADLFRPIDESIFPFALILRSASGRFTTFSFKLGLDCVV